MPIACPEPQPYDLKDPKDVKRLLNELSHYLNPTMPCREAFLKDGTDAKGRKMAMDALDKIRYKPLK